MAPGQYSRHVARDVISSVIGRLLSIEGIARHIGRAGVVGLGDIWSGLRESAISSIIEID